MVFQIHELKGVIEPGRQIYEKPEHLELLGCQPSKHVLQQLLGSKIRGRVKPRLHRFDSEKINFELVAQVVRHIHQKAQKGMVTWVTCSGGPLQGWQAVPRISSLKGLRSEAWRHPGLRSGPPRRLEA